MSSGASEIEKIKSESVDYLIWLDACGIIDWNTYNYVSDFYSKLLMKAYEQGMKDAQPELCEDTVSRKSVEDVLHGYFDGMLETDTWSPKDVYGLIELLPSVTPKPESCDDAVSRKELLKFFSNNGEGSWTYDTVAQGYIKALPSVMPGRHICDTCKHYPPSKKWPYVDCDMRNPADRWETDMR